MNGEILSKYVPVHVPELTNIINEMFLDRRVKSIMSNSIKPSILQSNITATTQVDSPCRPFSTDDCMNNQILNTPRDLGFKLRFSPTQGPVAQQETLLENDQQEKVIPLVRAKILKQYATRNLAKRVKMELKYNNALLNFLHKTNLIQEDYEILPPFSALETKQESSYPAPNYWEPYRKEYPHFSNIIPFAEMPIPREDVKFLVQKPKLTLFDRDKNQAFQNTVMRLGTVIKFVYHYLKSNGESFDKIGKELGVATNTAKLLFDVLVRSMKLERELRKLNRMKSTDPRVYVVQYLSTCNNIKTRLVQMFNDLQQESQYITRDNHMINLKRLHDLIIEYEY